MERAMLRDLRFQAREEALVFLKKLWNQQPTACPICGNELTLLHKKAKKSDMDWQCKACSKTFKTIHLLDEINEQFPV